MSNIDRTWLVFVSWNMTAKFVQSQPILLAMFRPRNLRSNCRVSRHRRRANWQRLTGLEKQWPDHHAMLGEFSQRLLSTTTNIQECDVHTGQVSRRMAAIGCTSHAKVMSYQIRRIPLAPLHLFKKIRLVLKRLKYDENLTHWAKIRNRVCTTGWTTDRN